jgi:AcrR family transcriptional regulator
MPSADPAPPGAALASPRAARTRHLLRERATDLFLRQGVNATTTTSIVDAAGVSRSTFYSYYPDKSTLLIEIAGTFWDGVERLILGLGGIASWNEASLLRYLTVTVAPFWEANRALIGLLGQYYGDEDLYRERISLIIERLGSGDPRWNQGDVIIDKLRLHLVVAAFISSMAFRLVWPDACAGDRDLDLLADYLDELMRPGSRRALDRPWRTGRSRRRGAPAAGEGPPGLAGGGRQSPQGAGLREVQRLRTHDAILDAAARLYAAKGYTSTVVDDIVSAIGASRATFYLHFPDKAATLAALAERQWLQRDDLFRRLGQLDRWTPETLGSWIAGDIDSWPVKSYMTSLLREDRRPESAFRDHVERMVRYVLGAGGASRWDQMPAGEAELRSRFLVLNMYLIVHHWAFWEWTPLREHVIRAVGGACSLLLTGPY